MLIRRFLMEQLSRTNLVATDTMAFNLTGWPVVVVRCGTSAEGLPIGVQVVAPPGAGGASSCPSFQSELHGWQRSDLNGEQSVPNAVASELSMMKQMLTEYPTLPRVLTTLQSR